MRNILAIIILLHPLILTAEESEMYKIERIEAPIKDGARSKKEIMLSFPDNKGGLPSVTVAEFGRTRFASIKHTDSRLEVVIQFDEFSLDYYDYRLEAGKWVLSSKKPVCSLNGQISGRIAQVDIVNEETIDVKLHKEGSSLGKSGWDKELLLKDHKEKKDLQVERYALQNGVFSLVGEASKYRSKPDTKTEENQEQNKTQQDNR